MKKILFLLLIMATATTARAGDGDHHLGLQAGVLYPGMLNATLSVDFETKYHNAFEFYLDAFTEWKDCPDCGKVCKESFWKSNYGLSVGAAYKPTVNRTRNSVGRFRMGADVGTANRGFALGVELGYAPSEVVVENVHLGDSLMILNYKILSRYGSEDDDLNTSEDTITDLQDPGSDT